MFSDTVMDRDFTKNFLISCGAHALLVLMAYLAGTTFMNFFNNNDNVEIIRSSIRVDVVGMPKFTVKELREMQAEPVAEAVPEPEGAKAETKVKDETPDVIKKDDLVIQEKAEKKKSSFLSLITDYSSKKVAPSERKKGTTKSTNKDLDSLIIEGNRLSKGSALVGDYSDEQNSEFSAYVQTLPELVRAHWKLPTYLMNQNLKCKIAIYLSASGEVVKTNLIESSGQSEFDARAEKAIRDGSPYPKPDAAVVPRLANSGIILKFPL
ncbi:MAG: TonB C-terminal domain-containing protein [Bdellovibrionales bacterium]|nr:TonB C-terminal domain-containing protein [Bdellovibrionales bacterium]